MQLQQDSAGRRLSIRLCVRLILPQTNWIFPVNQTNKSIKQQQCSHKRGDNAGIFFKYLMGENVEVSLWLEVFPLTKNSVQVGAQCFSLIMQMSWTTQTFSFLQLHLFADPASGSPTARDGMRPSRWPVKLMPIPRRPPTFGNSMQPRVKPLTYRPRKWPWIGAVVLPITRPWRRM